MLNLTYPINSPRLVHRNPAGTPKLRSKVWNHIFSRFGLGHQFQQWPVNWGFLRCTVFLH